MSIEPDIAVDVSADVIRSLLQANFERLPLHQMAVQVLVASNLDLRLRVAEILDVDIGDATTTASGALEAAVSVSVRAEIQSARLTEVVAQGAPPSTYFGLAHLEPDVLRAANVEVLPNDVFEVDQKHSIPQYFVPPEFLHVGQHIGPDPWQSPGQSASELQPMPKPEHTPSPTQVEPLTHGTVLSTWPQLLLETIALFLHCVVHFGRHHSEHVHPPEGQPASVVHFCRGAQ